MLRKTTRLFVSMLTLAPSMQLTNAFAGPAAAAHGQRGCNAVVKRRSSRHSKVALWPLSCLLQGQSKGLQMEKLHQVKSMSHFTV